MRSIPLQLVNSCADPSELLSNSRHNDLMKRNRTTRTRTTRNQDSFDIWSIRAVIILQGTCIILGIIAGTTLEQTSKIAEGFLKILELVTRVG
jgi:hypothetical protein